jgi:hypothetical protein
MQLSRFVWLTALTAALTALPAAAHHSFAAEYDSTKSVDLKGTVTKVEWMNPHAHFYIDVKGPDGKTINWNMELASPNMLTRNGWKRTSLKEGDVISVVGSRAKDGSNTASVVNVVAADGKKFTFMAAQDGK